MARTQRTPPIPNMGYKQIRGEELGWRRDAGKLSLDRGRQAAYIYTRIVLVRIVS